VTVGQDLVRLELGNSPTGGDKERSTPGSKDRASGQHAPPYSDVSGKDEHLSIPAKKDSPSRLGQEKLQMDSSPSELESKGELSVLHHKHLELKNEKEQRLLSKNSISTPTLGNRGETSEYSAVPITTYQ
jgi:hypothetical protein